jgi:hypothetical protein
MPGRRSAKGTRRPPRKDRLIQTRVPRQLQETLEHEARRRRVTLSHLIRSIVEDSFRLVDALSGSVASARHARRRARRPGPADDASRVPSSHALSHVYGWSEVVLHRPVRCAGCAEEIGRGERGYAGLSDDRSAPRAWLCRGCIERLPASGGL